VKKKWLAVSFFLVFTLLAMPVFATEIFSDGFESGDFSQWDSVGGSAEVQSSVVYQGSYAARFYADYATAYKTISETEVYERFYVRWSSNPASGETFQFGGVFISGNPASCAMLKNDGGTIKWGIQYRGNDYAQHEEYAATPNPTTDTWYCVEVYFKSNTAGGAKLWVDGNEVLTISGTTIGATADRAYACSYYTSGSSTPNIYVDCVVVADTYIGPISGAQEKTFTLTETAQATASHVLAEEKQLQFQTSPSATSQFTLLKEGFYTATELVNTLASYILGKETTLTVKEYVKTETAQASAAYTMLLEKLFFQTATPAASALANMAKEATQVLHEFLETAHAQATLYKRLYTPTAETNLALVLAAFAAAIAIVALSLTITKKD